MTGLGTAVNVAAIIVGATVGLLIKGGLSERFQDTVTKAVGLSVMFVGMSGVLPGLLTVADGVLAVSYTHLDVYKRQAWGFRRSVKDMISEGLWRTGCIRYPPTAGPVSEMR